MKSANLPQARGTVNVRPRTTRSLDSSLHRGLTEKINGFINSRVLARQESTLVEVHSLTRVLLALKTIHALKISAKWEIKLKRTCIEIWTRLSLLHAQFKLVQADASWWLNESKVCLIRQTDRQTDRQTWSEQSIYSTPLNFAWCNPGV